MKKIILLGSMAFFTLSCGPDDDDNTVTNNTDPTQQTAILPVKMSIDGETMKINYSGTKILNFTSTSNSGDKAVFEYSGDFIASIKYYEGNVLQSAQEYTYLNNLLSKAVSKEYASNGITIQHSITNDYTHNNANSVTVKRTTTGGSVPQPIMTTTYSYSNGNMVSGTGTGTITTNGVTTNYTENITYTYATDKNYPFKNVTGFDKLVHTSEAADEMSYLFSNIKSPISSYKSSTNWTYPSGSGNGYTAYKYTTANYNSAGYPTYQSKIGTDLNGNIDTNDQPEVHTYEYNH